jgi:hypothetical protein
MDDEEAKSHITGGDDIFVARDNSGKCIGFAVSELKHDGNCKLLVFGGAAVDREYQNNGLYKSLNGQRISLAADLGCTSIMTRTQNPCVERGILDAMEEAKDAGVISAYALSERKMQIGAYGRMLTQEKPLSNDTILNKEYAKLNYGRGDAYELYFAIGVNA